MQKTELETVLALQNRAYQLLLWLDKHSETRPDFWSDETLRALEYAPEGEVWLRKLNPVLPFSLRTEDADFPALSRLVSAFFATSFEVKEQTRGIRDASGYNFIPQTRRRLVARTTGKKTKGQKEKLERAAHELAIIALEELAIENDLDLTRAQLQTIATQVLDATNLWSYAHELVRRSQFSSQGESVHQIWRTLDAKERQKLSAETIWTAREELLQAMNSV